jgi:hypothetical protein
MMEFQVESIGKQRPRHAAALFVGLWLRHLAPTRGGIGVDLGVYVECPRAHPTRATLDLTFNYATHAVGVGNHPTQGHTIPL